MPVVDGHELTGVLSFRDVRDLPASEWSGTLAREAAKAPKRVVTTRTPVTDVLPLLGDVDTERVPVVDDGRLVGLLDRHDVMRWLEAHARGAAMRRSEVF
jgi:CBS domain-containing protein